MRTEFNVHASERELAETVRVLLHPPYRVLQLGSKTWHAYAEPWIKAGAEVVGIDLDGKQNCRPFDLRKPIPPEAVGGRFEVVTNYGTTEHVTDQEPCWRNIHALLNPGGYVISAIPSPGHYPRHGLWYPTAAWYRSWAELNGYALVRFEPDKPLTLLIARKDGDLPFTMPAEAMHHESSGSSKVQAAWYERAQNR